MRCNQFEDSIALHLSGEISQELGEEFAQHRAACPRCAALLKQQIRADQLLSASLSAQPVCPLALKDRVRRRIAAPWWNRVLRMRTLHVAFASILVLIGVFVMAWHGQSRGADLLLESAASDHVEDVVQRIQKSGWVTDQSEAENLAATVIGDRRPVRSFAPAGYSLARARACNLEGRSQRWLHLIFANGSREVSFFVRSSTVSPASKGQIALDTRPQALTVEGYEVAGVRNGALGIVFVGGASQAESVEIVRAAATSVS